MKRRLSPIVLALSCLAPLACGRDFHLADFGVEPNSDSVQTAAIQRAVDECSRQGGGRVVAPAGDFTTGTIVLKDNVELHLSEGARLIASASYDDFPVFPPSEYRSQKDVGGWSALIFADGAENIAITGNGAIDGRGFGRKGRVSGKPGDSSGRPRNILFISCRNVKVEGVSMFNAASWNQHYLNCEDVVVSGISVSNHCNGNNDGIDIDGCRRFLLKDSVLDSDDDAIVLKSTGAAPCEDVVVRNCVARSRANAIKCGTESVGGFRRIRIEDCVVEPVQVKNAPKFVRHNGIAALSLEVVDGGVMDDVVVRNIRIEGYRVPIYVRLGARGRRRDSGAPPSESGSMRGVLIQNVEARNSGNWCSSVTGVPGSRIQDVRLENLRIHSQGGLAAGAFRTRDSASQGRHDVAPNFNPEDRYWASFEDVAEDEKGYPQPTVWGNLPSSGLFIRHVESLEMENAEFRSDRGEPRPAIVAQDVGFLRVRGLSSDSTAKERFVLDDVRRFESDGAPRGKSAP